MPAGSYAFTITGVSGPLTHTATVSLSLIAQSFTLASSPGQTVPQGKTASYNLMVTSVNGFSGQVSLSATGLPAGATGTFIPNPATSSFTLLVTTALNTPGGSYTLTVTGVAGSLVATTGVSLVVIPGVTADLFNNAEAGNIGDLLSVPILNASTQGSGGSWITSNVQKFSVGTPNLGVFANQVIVAGGSYDGSGSHSWDYDHSVDGQFVKYQTPSGQLKVSVGMFLQAGPNGTYGTYDFLELRAFDGMGCVLQLFDSPVPSYHTVWAHSAASSYGTQVGVGIPINANATYWMSLQYDSVTGLCSLAVFDPVTFVQIGVTSMVPLDTNQELFLVILGSNGHLTTTDAHTFFDNVVVDWTEGKFPLLPR
jgi:hypothetical protein